MCHPWYESDLLSKMKMKISTKRYHVSVVFCDLVRTVFL